MLLQTNSYIVPTERRAEHARLIRRFRQALMKLGCDQFEVYEQVGANWSPAGANGRYVQIMRFRDRQHQQAVQAAERSDPGSQQIIAEFCELINFPYQQQHGYFATGFYTGVLPVAARQLEYQEPAAEEGYEEGAEQGEGEAGEEVAESEQPAEETDGEYAAEYEETTENEEEPPAEDEHAPEAEADDGTDETEAEPSDDETFPEVAKSVERAPRPAMTEDDAGGLNFDQDEQTPDAAHHGSTGGNGHTPKNGAPNGSPRPGNGQHHPGPNGNGHSTPDETDFDTFLRELEGPAADRNQRGK